MLSKKAFVFFCEFKNTVKTRVAVEKFNAVLCDA